MNRIRILALLLTIISMSYLYSEELSQDLLDKIETITDDIDRAPDFSLNSIHRENNDSTYTLSQMKNKIVLLNFWATWCGPCRLEIPDFNELYKKYNKKGFEILGISLSDSKEQLEQFSSVYKIDYPLLYGKASEIGKLTAEYGGIYTIPISILIGPNNQILRVYPGAILKKYDPNMYSDLIYNIESSITKLEYNTNLKE